jgi:beta-lactamase class A
VRSILVALVALALLPAAAEAQSACWTKRVARADAVARSRAGDVGFAVIDDTGHLHGRRYSQPVRGVSTIKSLLLLTFLHQRSVRRRALTGAEKDLLTRMITVSDNGAAGTLIARLGRTTIEAEARHIGMRSFHLVDGFWGLSPTSARDQAVLFRRLDANLPKRHRTFARHLFASIVSYQRWGVPQGAPRGWKVLFKGGWGYGTGKAVHQGARLEHAGHVLGLGITTFGNSGTEYGATTIELVTKALLRPKVCAS